MNAVPTRLAPRVNAAKPWKFPSQKLESKCVKPPCKKQHQNAPLNERERVIAMYRGTRATRAKSGLPSLRNSLGMAAESNSPEKREQKTCKKQNIIIYFLI